MAQSVQPSSEHDAAVGEVSRVAALSRGAVLDGIYRIEEPLGAGAGGAVYRAVHLELQRSFAIKVLENDLDFDAAARLAQEARTTSAIEHDHIVRVTHMGRDATGRLYVVMELLEGEDLRARLERQRATERPFPLLEARSIVTQALAGLAAAHDAGVIHRDIKPANIFLAQKRGEVVVKLVDFGMSRQLTSDVSVTRTGALVGTPLYMAPEQSNDVRVDARADVYSLGVVAYEVLSGCVPFEGDTLYACVLAHALTPPPPLRELRSDIPEAVAAVVHRCLAKAPADRYVDAAAAGQAWATAWESAFADPTVGDDAQRSTTGDDAQRSTTGDDDDGRRARRTDIAATREPPMSLAPDRQSRVPTATSAGPPATRLRSLAGVAGVVATALFALGWWSSRQVTPSGPHAAIALAGERDHENLARADSPAPPASSVVPVPGAHAMTTAESNGPGSARTHVLVTSDPLGATVQTAEGLVLGATPLRVDVGDGPVALRVSLRGFTPQRVSVSANSPASLTVPLQRTAAPRRATRTSPPLPMLAPR
ncbi:MAG: serine/threonine protein kinase [Myxococcales bacterium]|nr:serine/threonine protein kinase [Myxococcales bacterium]